MKTLAINNTMNYSPVNFSGKKKNRTLPVALLIASMTPAVTSCGVFDEAMKEVDEPLVEMRKAEHLERYYDLISNGGRMVRSTTVFNGDGQWTTERNNEYGIVKGALSFNKQGSETFTGDMKISNLAFTGSNLPTTLWQVRSVKNKDNSMFINFKSYEGSNEYNVNIDKDGSIKCFDKDGKELTEEERDQNLAILLLCLSSLTAAVLLTDKKVSEKVKNYKSKSNTSFKSVLKPTEFLKSGIECAKKINSKANPEFSDLYNVRNFAQGLMDIINDGRNHLVEISKSDRKSTFALYYNVLINGIKVIIEDKCLGIKPQEVGKNAMGAVRRLTQKPYEMTSSYERLVAGVERKPLPFKDTNPPVRVNYSQKENESLLENLEKIVFNG